MIEGIALLGVLVGFALIAYGAFSLPDIVPTHIGIGGINSYGSKWPQLITCFILIFGCYGGITLVNQYLYKFYHPTDPNASATYHLYQDILRGIKLIIASLQTILTGSYILGMQKNQYVAIGSMGILITISIMIALFTSLFIIGNSLNNVKSKMP